MANEPDVMTEEQMLQAAREFDSQVEGGAESPQFEIPDEAPPSEEPEAETEPDSEVEEISDDGDDADIGSDSTEEEGNDTEEESTESPDAESKKSKWEKNESRKRSSWKQINEEKETLNLREQQIAQRAKELEEARARLAEGQEYRDEKGHTASDYEAAAKELKEDGEDYLAKEAESRALAVREEAKQASINAEKQKAAEAWEAKRISLMEKIPELKNNDSELVRISNELLKSHPILTYSPEGLEYAAEVAQLKIDAAEGKKAKSDVEKLNKKLKQYEKKMSVSGGFTPSRPEGEKSFDDMESVEQEAFLRRAAAMADEGV